MNHTLAFKKIIGKCGLTAYENEPLSRRCTWKIGGPADFLVEPSSETQIREILVFCRANQIPHIVIGKGSNLLFDDAGLRGIVISLDKHFSSVSVRESVIVAQSGVFVPRLARLAWRHGLSGLEHTVGIPGNLGGLVVMNGGSGRQGIGSCVRHVWVMDACGRAKVFNNNTCFFEYRQSIFQSLKMVITKVELKLEKKCSEAIRQDMLSVLRSRRSRLPRKEPNCGSVFRSDPGPYETVGPPGSIIEAVGLKGLRVGNAEVSRKHANFIVNKGGAKASDVLELIRQIRAVVYEKMGIWIECEVKYVTVMGKIWPVDEVL